MATSASKPPIVEWFQKEIFANRVKDSIFRAAILQFSFLYCFIFISSNKFDIWAPLQTISGPFWTLVAPSSWGYNILVGLSLTIHGVLLARHAKPEPFVPVDRASWIARVLSKDSLSSLAFGSFVGAAFMRSLLGYHGGPFNSLSTPCSIEQDVKCLNGPHLFLVFSGLISGLLYWYHLFMQNGSLLLFPAINQLGASRLRSCLYRLFKQAVRASLLNLRWFLILYVLVGPQISTTLKSFFKTGPTYFTEGSYSAWLWLQLQAVATCCTLNAFLLFSLSCTTEIVKINLTKPLCFEVDGQFTLAEAMAQKHSLLLKYLSFQDFTEIASNSGPRRQVLYTLSQPGGHPRHWNAVYQAWSDLVHDFVNDLTNSSRQALLAEVPGSSSLTTKRGPFVQKQEQLQATNHQGLQSTIQQVVSKLKKNSLFAEFPDGRVRSVFATSQLVIWAVEGLSNLVAASLMEDQFGVIQRQLPDIMATFLSLIEVTDRHRGNTVKLKPQEAVDIMLKLELRSACKISMYKICQTFGPKIFDIDLPPTLKAKVENYRNFMEG